MSLKACGEGEGEGDRESSGAGSCEFNSLKGGGQERGKKIK